MKGKGWYLESMRHSLAAKGLKSKIKLPKGKTKIKKVMGEFKAGKLHSGRDGIVTSRKQAIAIALSEQRKADNYALKADDFRNAGDQKTSDFYEKKLLEAEKLLARVKEEAKTSKEYAKEGYISQAKDEARHAKFFKKEAKKIKEPKHKTYSFGESPGHYAVGWHTDWEYDTKELAEIRRSRLAKAYPDTRLRKGRGHRYAVQYFTP